MHQGTKLHENKIARVHKIARKYFCTKTNLHELKKKLPTEGKGRTNNESKKKIIEKKTKTNKKI